MIKDIVIVCDVKYDLQKCGYKCEEIPEFFFIRNPKIDWLAEMSLQPIINVSRIDVNLFRVFVNDPCSMSLNMVDFIFEHRKSIHEDVLLDANKVLKNEIPKFIQCYIQGHAG